MNPSIQQFVQVCAGVFIGTLPLVAMIGWAAFQNNHRLGLIEDRLKTIETKLDALTIRIGSNETKIAVIEAKIDGQKLIVQNS